MKLVILACACLCLPVIAQAQTSKFDHTNNISTPNPPVKLKVTLSNDSLFIVYNNQEIPGASIQLLDSLLKKVPNLKQLAVEFEGINAEPEKKKSVDAVLKQCKCHVSGHFISMNRF
jgi:hypothetical protein